MKTKNIVSILIIAIVAMLMLTAVVASAESVSAASKKVKVTWNANGGKIGTAKVATTSVKKGAKIGKLKTAKKTGYIFAGWYTKKTGGTKITKATKVKKKVTYYAHWNKKKTSTTNTTRVLNAEEKKLVGKWELNWDGSSVYEFKADGTYSSVSDMKYFSGGSMYHSYWWGEKGYYSVKNGKLTLQYQYAKDYNNVFVFSNAIWSDWETGTPKEITFFTEDGKQYMRGLAGDLSFIKVS